MIEFYKRTVRELMTNYIRRHSVAIWQDGPGGKGIGSGTCIKIRDRLFVATAAHNFEDIPHGGTITVFSTSSNTPLRVIGEDYGEYGAAGTLDLGWLEIELGSASECGLEGLPLEVVAPYHTQQDDDVYQITGFPIQRAEERIVNGHPDYAVPLVIYNTVPGRDASVEPDNLLINYDRNAVTDRGLEEMPEPHGISGGGTWYIPPPDMKKVWSPMEHPLVGIVIHYLPISRQIRSLRIHHWLNLLLTDHPQFSAQIEPLLNQTS